MVIKESRKASFEKRALESFMKDESTKEHLLGDGCRSRKGTQKRCSQCQKFSMILEGSCMHNLAPIRLRY